MPAFLKTQESRQWALFPRAKQKGEKFPCREYC